MKLENVEEKTVQEAKRLPNGEDNQTPALGSNWCCCSSVKQPFFEYSGAMYPLKKNQHLNVESCDILTSNVCTKLSLQRERRANQQCPPVKIFSISMNLPQKLDNV